MNITPTTARRDFTVQGLIFKAFAPFSAGYVLDESDAGVLNQVFGENIRNNLAKQIDGLRNEDDTYKQDEHGNPWTDERVQAEIIDPYMLQYQWGARGSRKAMDPEERQARQLCADAVKQAFRSQGKKLPENLDEYIEANYVRLRDTWHATAAKMLAAAKKSTPTVDLNLSAPEQAAA